MITLLLRLDFKEISFTTMHNLLAIAAGQSLPYIKVDTFIVADSPGCYNVH